MKATLFKASLQVIFFRQYPPETGTVDQIESRFFIREELERGVLGVVYDIPGFLQSEIDLPEQDSRDVHGPAQPAKFPLFSQKRFSI